MTKSEFRKIHSLLRLKARDDSTWLLARGGRNHQTRVQRCAAIDTPAGPVAIWAERECYLSVGHKVFRPEQPCRVTLRAIVDRAPRARAAIELDWAARYRREAAKARPEHRAGNKLAVRMCIADARRCLTPLAALA